MKITGRNCLVTGAAGFIGSHLVDRLLTHGAEVIGVDDLSIGHLGNLSEASKNPKFKFVKLDILHPEPLKSLLKNVDYVFHLATRSVRLSLRQPSLVHAVNTQGTYNVLTAAAEARVKKFLYVSSSEVNGTAQVVPMKEDYTFAPETIYGASKLAGEYYTQVFHRSGWLETTIARPHNNYGPRAHYAGSTGELIPRFILKCLLGLPLSVYGDGNQTRDFTFVRETCDILIRLMESDSTGGEVVNVCRGEEVSVLKIAQLVQRFLESGSAIEHLPARKNDVLRLYGDNSKLRDLINFVPTVSIEEGLRETISWYKANIPLNEATRSSLTGLAWNEEPCEKWIEDLSNSHS